jgi:hypothetical protein
MVSFQCSFNGANLCLNNGTCTLLQYEVTTPVSDTNLTTTTTITFNEYGCACPVNGGNQFDFVFYHFPSCTLPNDAYLAFLIYYSIVAFILIFFLVREFWTISHGKTRQIAISNVLDLILTWCQIISCYFQNGAFEGNAVFACLSFACTFYMGGKLSISFMETLHAVRRVPIGKFREALKICTILACVSSLICGLAMIGTCRGSNRSYNLAAWFMETSLIFWVVAFCSVIAYYTNLLLGNISHASTLRGTTTENKRAIVELIRKVKIIRNCAIYNAFLISVIGIPKSLAFLIIGSIPYQWIFGYAFLYQGLIVMSIGVLLFVRHTQTKKQRKGKSGKYGGGGKPGQMGENGENDDKNQSSSPAEDSAYEGGAMGPMKTKRKEDGMHTDGRYGRTWLFRGSSLMTKQGGLERTKMTHDQEIIMPNGTTTTGGITANNRAAGSGGNKINNANNLINNGNGGVLAPPGGSPRPMMKTNLAPVIDEKSPPYSSAVIANVSSPDY